MATAFEELRVLQDAEAVTDEIWQQVVDWDPFFSETDLEWLQTVPICDDQSPFSNL